MNRKRGLVLVAIVVSGAVVVLVLLRPGADDRAWPLDSAEDLPGSRLLLNYGLPSPCEERTRVEVVESPAEVSVILWISDDGGDCTANVVSESHTVQLKRPLGDRRVVDGGCLKLRRKCDDLPVERP